MLLLSWTVIPTRTLVILLVRVGIFRFHCHYIIILVVIISVCCTIILILIKLAVTTLNVIVTTTLALFMVIYVVKVFQKVPVLHNHVYVRTILQKVKDTRTFLRHYWIWHNYVLFIENFNNLAFDILIIIIIIIILSFYYISRNLYVI